MSGDIKNVSVLPVWKKGATAVEFLDDIALMARKSPERFTRIAIVYDEDLPLEPGEEYPRTVTRYASHGTSNSVLISMLEIGKRKVLDWMFGDDCG